MMSSEPRIRPAHKVDVLKFRDRPYRESFRGLVVEHEGKILAVCGVLHTYPLQAFSSIDDELRKYPKIIMRTGRLLKNILNSYSGTIYAIASNKERNSAAFLERLGFNHIEGRVYQWPIQ